MQFTNQNECKTTTPYSTAATTTTTSTTATAVGSCASSTDSGIIIIDNSTTFNNKNNNYNNSNFNINNDNNNATSTTPTAIATATTTTTTTTSPLYNTKKDNINAQRASQKHNNNAKLKLVDGVVDVNDEEGNSSEKFHNYNIENIINIHTIDVDNDVKDNVNKNEYDDQTTCTNNGRRKAEQKYYNSNAANNINGGNCNSYSKTNTTKKCSPTVSIRSTTISIVSIDENAIDSSVVDSDSDFEADAEGVHSNYVVKKLGQQVTYPPDSSDLPNINKGLRVVSQKISPGSSISAAGAGSLAANILNGSAFSSTPATSTANGLISPTTPQIGSIALTNSTDVTFGDKHFFEGPVTIQQFLIDSRDKTKSTFADGSEDGHDNPAYGHAHTNGRDNSSKTSLPERNKPYKFISNRKIVIITSAILLLTLLVGILIVTTSSIFKSSTGKNNNEDNDDGFKDGELNFVQRHEWQARPSGTDLTKLKLPVHRVIVSHTASDTCNSIKICTYRLQLVQAFHMDSQRWSDIGYNFLIGGDGRIYVGRGWDIQGAHTKGYNHDTISISFVGTYTTVRPTERQLASTQLLLAEGVRLKKLVPDYRLYGARQLASTESPGEELYAIIKTWKNWSSKI